MKRAAFLSAAMALALAGCEGFDKAASLELQPKEHVFKKAGDELWWKAIPKTKQGKLLRKKQGEVRWTSSDEKVAVVDPEGKVRSKGPGQTTLTATFDGLSVEARIEVVTVGKVTVEPAELSFEARGEPKPLTIKVFDYLGRELKDRMPLTRCQNEDVCRTSNQGVHPVDPGETVAVVSAEGQQAEVKVKVEPSKQKKE